jgi:hypothetical protein
MSFPLFSVKPLRDGRYCAGCQASRIDLPPAAQLNRRKSNILRPSMHVSLEFERPDEGPSSGPVTVGWFLTKDKGAILYDPPERLTVISW